MLRLIICRDIPGDAIRPSALVTLQELNNASAMAAILLAAREIIPTDAGPLTYAPAVTHCYQSLAASLGQRRWSSIQITDAPSASVLPAIVNAPHPWQIVGYHPGIPTSPHRALTVPSLTLWRPYKPTGFALTPAGNPPGFPDLQRWLIRAREAVELAKTV